jgi:hypothetical protein
MPGLVISILLFISVFLPWITASALGSSQSANGMDSSWGYLTLIMGILGIVASFILPQKSRSFSFIVIGVLAIVGVISFWIAEYGVAKDQGVTQYISMGFGLWVAGILGFILLIFGLINAFRPGQPAQPPPASPPTPPAPQQ